MKNSIKLLISVSTIFMSAVTHAQSLTLEQVLQRVVDHYPSLKTAAIQVERAQQEMRKAEGQLGWQLGAQAGVNRELGLLGTPTDRTNLNANITRKLESGATFGIEGGVLRDDSETVFSPAIPNPSTTTNFGLSFRQPLAQGADNPLYKEALASAEAGTDISQAQQEIVYDQLAAQIVELYMAAASTRARVVNLANSIGRVKRLQNYILGRTDLGLSEEKDILQVNAQLNSQRAELQGLNVLWQQQKISLNRLMGREWSDDITPSGLKALVLNDKSYQSLYDLIVQHNPEIKQVDGRIKLADSTIRSRRDARDDNLDLVFNIGNQRQSGDTATGDISESEIVGGVSLEYQHGFDKQAEDAELYQAQLDRSTALQDKRQLLEDLQYNASSLLAEINAGVAALEAYKTSAKSENKKLDEARDRYKRGRTDTDQLIQFENELAVAELLLELQYVELARRQYNLDLLTGGLWKNIIRPEYHDFINEQQGVTP